MSDQAPAGEPDDPRNDPLPRPKCRGVTKRGAPCRNHAAAGSAFCGAHGGGAKTGAPRKLTQERHDTIVKAIEDGAHLHIAARSAGIHPDTFREWREQGERDLKAGQHTDYAELSVAVHDAQARGEVALTRMIRNAAADGDWRAALAILERRHPERWARRQHVDLTTTEQSAPRTVDPATPGQAEQIREILGRALQPPPSTT